MNRIKCTDWECSSQKNNFHATKADGLSLTPLSLVQLSRRNCLVKSAQPSFFWNLVLPFFCSLLAAVKLFRILSEIDADNVHSIVTKDGTNDLCLCSRLLLLLLVLPALMASTFILVLKKPSLNVWIFEQEKKVPLKITARDETFKCQIEKLKQFLCSCFKKRPSAKFRVYLLY